MSSAKIAGILLPADQEIQKIIGQYAEIQGALQDRIAVLREELRGMDAEIYAYVAWPAPMPEPCGANGSADSRLLRIIEHIDRHKLDLTREILDGLERLESEYRRNQRIHICYKSLPYEEYNILNLLYEKRIPWKSIQNVTQMRKSDICSIRNAALNRIRENYCSTTPNVGLLANTNEIKEGN